MDAVRIVDGRIDNFVGTYSDFGWAVATGRIPGTETFNITGFNPNLTTADIGSELWSPGTPLVLPDLATPQSMVLRSDNANDTVAGTGARTVFIDGLGTGPDPLTGVITDGVRQSELVDTNGLTDVNLTLEYSRIFAARVLDSGSSETNEGTISIVAPNPFDTQAQIVVGARGVGDGVSKRIQRTIPANHIGIVESLLPIVDRTSGGPQLVFYVVVRLFGGNTWSLEGVPISIDLSTDTSKEFVFKPPSILPPLTDITAFATASAVNTGAGMRIGMTLLRVAIEP